MTTAALSHKHLFLPAAGGAATAPTVVALHGTGGDEQQFAFLHDWLGGGYNLLAPRGQVSEYGANRYFRRLAEGVFDLPDLHRRTQELAAFLHDAAAAYGFPIAQMSLIGYSNGANIGGSLLLQQAIPFRKAALLHAMVPFAPEAVPDLAATAILVTQGQGDPTMPPGHADQVERLYRSTGAQVTVQWYPYGHSLTEPELRDALAFLQQSSGSAASQPR